MRRFLVVLAACGGGGDTVALDGGPCVDTHDEDGDGIGDRCDICPAAPDPAQRDTTEAATMIVFPDGVGDACDPRPALSGDKLRALHVFADPARASDWTGTGWTIDADRAIATGPARWVAKQQAGGDGLYVQARVAQLDWAAGGAFELALDGDGADVGLVCGIEHDRDGDGNDELVAREIGGAMMTKGTGMPIAGAITLSAWRLIDVQRNGFLRCRATFDDGMAELEIPTIDDAAIGIYAFAQTAQAAQVSSLVVYTSPTLPSGSNQDRYGSEALVEPNGRLGSHR